MNKNDFDKQHVAYYAVAKEDLPFCCPPEAKKNAINHPKVYLSFDENNKAVCEYCGADYILENDG